MTLTEAEITHYAATTPRHHIIGVNGDIRWRTEQGGWSDTPLWPPQMQASAGLTWRLEGDRPLAYEIVHDPVTGTHRLIVHDTAGDRDTVD